MSPSGAGEMRGTCVSLGTLSSVVMADGQLCSHLVGKVYVTRRSSDPQGWDASLARATRSVPESTGSSKGAI